MYEKSELRKELEEFLDAEVTRTNKKDQQHYTGLARAVEDICERHLTARFVANLTQLLDGGFADEHHTHHID